jgi:hypothetical protein
LKSYVDALLNPDMSVQSDDNGTRITSQNISYSTISPDGSEIVYIARTNGGYLYKKNSNDTSDGVKITSYN